MLRRIFPTSRLLLSTTFGVAAALAALAPGEVREAHAQEDPLCLSEDPADWPASAKPYFLIVVDTSGSMAACTNPVTVAPETCPTTAVENSCGLPPSRLNDAKCALQQTVQAFSGQVNFGLATFAPFLTGCPAGDCVSDCVPSPIAGNPNRVLCDQPALYQGSAHPGDDYGCTVNIPAGAVSTCSNLPSCNGGPGFTAPSFLEGTWRNGANIVVPMKRDGLDPDNTNTLLSWFDGDCSGNAELFARGATPIAGSLRSAAQYFRTGWRRWSDTNYCPPTLTHPTPLSAADRGCRNINVLLVTDGDESCDNQAGAVAAATDLFGTGATFGGTNFPIRTHVINFAGGTQANTNQIAAAGGTTTSLSANNEASLALALSTIISGSVAPEECDNLDNNCNGCTDEGYRHHCNVKPPGQCCAGARATCLANYEASITAGDPDGDLTLLPCTTALQQTQPANWLCFDPGEICDNADNNCQDGTDEGITKCGNPLTCPGPEVCDGQDNDCDGVIDNGVCGGCVPSAETCDGCDNDCDGILDNNIPSQPCGILGDPTCEGTRECTTPEIGVTPGSCPGGASFGQCSSQGGAEVCNGDDDDCDGVIDDGIPPRACVPAGTPGGLVFGGNSQCRQGQEACTGAGAFGPCIGFVGPSQEICDLAGIDEDCDGLVNENDPDLLGDGEECGINSPPECTPGLTQCVAGALQCVGAVGGGDEVCDGQDNDCDGQTDEAPLVDAPVGGNGCWTLPVAGCPPADLCAGFAGLTWCKPPGAECGGNGTLAAPCSAGTLACAGGAGWVCQNDTLPEPEACDGLDNNCDGQTDEGSFPGEGVACGDADPPCQLGQTECVGGFLDCVGDIGPEAEVCNGEDDDCDLEVDEGIPVGLPCTPAYDEEAFPGDRTAAPCEPGVLQCDGAGGEICVGGRGPEAEICDGLNNDCDVDDDGNPLTDETGGAPDGIDGTTNPEDPSETIGDACGVNEGICSEGALGCLNGRFECLGGEEPQVETCDCEDNDCDGTNDNENPGGNPALCSAGKDCIKTAGQCQCAAPCGAGEFPCPGGQTCETVTSSETGEELGSYCVAQLCPGGCADKTVQDGAGVVLCAPAGTILADCAEVPVCECNGQFGCQPPCAGVTCDPPLTCASYGAQAGTCVPDNCFNGGCQGCDSFCAATGDCATNPCAAADACADDEVCVPSDDGTTFTCKGSCADVDCDAGTVCKGGECVAECSPACAADEVCDYSQTPAQCVENQCTDESCPLGGCCDPLDGTCGACACNGVTCPDGETCVADECVGEGGGTGGSGAGGGATTGTGAGGEGAAAATGGPGAGSTGAGNGVDGRALGLATGGGGCQCEIGAGSEPKSSSRFALALAIGGLALLRRSQRRAKVVAAKEVSR